MPAAAHSAVGHRFGIVDSVVDGFERAQIREERLQIIVFHLADVPPRHHWADRPRTHFSRSHGPQELILIVVTDARGGRCQVRTGHFPAYIRNEISARKFESW